MGNKYNTPMATLWEQAVIDGKAFEISAVANGTYHIGAGVKFALTATGSDISIMMQGYEIFSDQSPFDITFYEDAVITGGASVSMAVTSRNRLSGSSRATIGMTVGLTAISGTPLTPVAAYANSTTSFALQNTYGVSETWILAPNKIYAVYGYNKSSTAADLTARMLWIENNA